MRHQKKVKKLGRTASHRKAMLRNIASALIEHHQIRTTLTKAKAAQSYMEKLISYGKNDTVHSRRLAFKMLQNRTLVKMLFDDIATTFSDRKGGYTRVVKLGQRRGDGAPLAILQLVGFEQLVVEEETPKKKKGKGKAAKKETARKEAAGKKAGKAAAEEEVTPEETTEQVEEAVELEAEKKPKKARSKAKKTEAAAEEIEKTEAPEAGEVPEATETEETKAAEEEKPEPKAKKKKTSKKEAAEDKEESESGEEKK